MERIDYIEERYLGEYVSDTLQSARIASVEVENAKYHHNRKFERTPEIIRHGIMSAQKRMDLGITSLTEKQLSSYEDESYVNGKDYISLAVVGLTDLYQGEDEYNPFVPHKTDILITSSLKTRRSSNNYGNEFLAESIILPSEFRAIDFRILKLIEQYKNGFNSKTQEEKFNEIITAYNSLRKIAIAIKETNLDIPFREMSDENITLDIDKASEFKEVVLVRK